MEEEEEILVHQRGVTKESGVEDEVQLSEVLTLVWAQEASAFQMMAPNTKGKQTKW